VDAIPSTLKGKDISGAINFLLVGIDQRNSGPNGDDLLRSDSIILVHIPADHKTAYMISLPRDLYVNIPAYPATHFAGGMDRINAAFAFGARKPNGQRDTSIDGRTLGVGLTMETISGMVPGGLKFNGSAIIDFDGFKAVLEALGGVTMCVDEQTASIRMSPTGQDYGYDLDIEHNPKGMKSLAAAVASGKVRVYQPGCQHLQPWEALDYARQRDWLAWGDGDYGRQRHQQQLIKAIISEVASTNTLTNFGKIGDLQKAAGDLLVLDTGGNALEDWVLTLSSLRSNDMVMIKTNGGKFASDFASDGTTYLGEKYTSDLQALMTSVQNDDVYDFLAAHQDWIASDAAAGPTATSTAGH